MKDMPTEGSVLRELKRGPMRPPGVTKWTIGTYAPEDARTRRILDNLVEKGLAKKKPGGWYALASTDSP